jgi:hypothetical protein
MRFKERIIEPIPQINFYEQVKAQENSEIGQVPTEFCFRFQK